MYLDHLVVQGLMVNLGRKGKLVLMVPQGPEDSLVHLVLTACPGLWAHQGHHLLLMASLLPDTVKPLKNRRVHLEQG